MAKYGYCKTEKDFVNWLRSALRRVWCKHPVKMQMLQDRRVKGPSNTGRLVFKVRCERCGNLFKMADVEVNHKEQVGKNLSLENFNEYAQKLLVVKEEDLEILCKGCHSVTTYAERMGIDLENAEIEKKVIKFKNKPAAQQITGLKSLGIVPARTEKERIVQAREYLRSKKK